MKYKRRFILEIVLKCPLKVKKLSECVLCKYHRGVVGSGERHYVLCNYEG